MSTPDAALLEKYSRAMQKVSRWRTVLASWQLGTRSDTDGECRAVKDHREATILLRLELNALTALLVRKGVFKEKEFTEQLIQEADFFDKTMEKRFPGFRTSESSVDMNVPEALQTIQKYNFPP